MSDVTIVVATRDRRTLVLESVARHLTLPERPAVIVVDDGSSDDTAAALARTHPAVRVLRLPRAIGAAARNRGIAAARTTYVALTDDDAWWAPGTLAASAALLDRHPRLALVNPLIRVGRDGHVDPVCVEMARSPLPRARGQPGHPLLSFIACAAVARRDAVLAAGGFCERLVIGGEEELLGWDLVAADWQLSYVPGLVARHCPPLRSIADRPRRRELTTRNALWAPWLRRPLATAAVCTLRELRRQPADRVSARAVVRAVAGIPWVVRARRPGPPRVEALRRILDDAARAGAA